MSETCKSSSQHTGLKITDNTCAGNLKYIVPLIDVARAGEQRKTPKKLSHILGEVIESVIKKGSLKKGM